MNDGAEPPPPPFPDTSMIVAHKTKIAVKEKAGFHFAGGGISEQMALCFPAVIPGMDFRVEWVNTEIRNCFWQAASVLG